LPPSTCSRRASLHTATHCNSLTHTFTQRGRTQSLPCTHSRRVSLHTATYRLPSTHSRRVSLHHCNIPQHTNTDTNTHTYTQWEDAITDCQLRTLGVHLFTAATHRNTLAHTPTYTHIHTHTHTHTYTHIHTHTHSGRTQSPTAKYEL